jgi:hypothetical protein
MSKARRPKSSSSAVQLSATSWGSTRPCFGIRTRRVDMGFVTFLCRRGAPARVARVLVARHDKVGPLGRESGSAWPCPRQTEPITYAAAVPSTAPRAVLPPFRRPGRAGAEGAGGGAAAGDPPARPPPHARHPARADGLPVRVVSERLGHASATITLTVYQHVHPGMGRPRSADSFDGMHVCHARYGDCCTEGARHPRRRCAAAGGCRTSNARPSRRPPPAARRGSTVCDRPATHVAASDNVRADRRPRARRMASLCPASTSPRPTARTVIVTSP